MRPKQTRATGFTLLEMMTALAVFGVIGVLATQILSSTITLGQTTASRGSALADLQRAVNVISRDVAQFAHREVRDELGEALPKLTIEGTSLIELTRAGWQNPLGAPRAEVQRVAYVLEDEKLIRAFWPVLDRAPDSKPVVQVLLEGVEEAAFAAQDIDGERYTYWPLVDSDDETAPELAAIEMTLALAQHGRIDRLWLIPSEASKSGSGREGPPGERLSPDPLRARS